MTSTRYFPEWKDLATLHYKAEKTCLSYRKSNATEGMIGIDDLAQVGVTLGMESWLPKFAVWRGDDDSNYC